MSEDPRIATLEALLARVLSRKRGPAGNGHHAATDDVATGFHASFAPPSPAPSEPPLMPPPPPPPPSPKPPAPHFASIATPVQAFFPTQPPPRDRPSATPAKPQAPTSTIAPPDASLDQSLAEMVSSPSLRPRLPRPEASEVRPVEPPVSLVELPDDLFEPPAPRLELEPPDDFGGLDAGAESPPVPSPPTSIGREEVLESKSRLVSAPPATSLDELEDEPFPASPASDPTLEVGLAEVPDVDLDEEDRAPSSSRRPISLEAKMNELDDAPPLHPPPPASGRLPAANLIEAAMESSATGLKSLDALLEEERDLEAAAEHATTGSSAVALFVGEAPRGQSPTFGELLDEALKL